MSKKVLFKIGNTPIYWDEDEGKVWFVSEFTIDADGSPKAYGPEGSEPEPLDWIANAGYPGNWWGIVTDSDGEPYEQEAGDKKKWPYPGLYLSTTAYLWGQYDKYDARRYVDSGTVAFTVVPGNVRMAVEPKFMGATCRVTDKKTKKVIGNVPCCDVGPSNHCGEGSMWLAEQFGLDPNPKCGGSSDRSRFLWEFWPGYASATHPLQ